MLKQIAQEGMIMNEIAQIVASIGFPAAAFIMAGWYIVSKDKQHKEEIETLTKAHKEESNGLRRAIDQLTTAVKELLDEWRKAQ